MLPIWHLLFVQAHELAIGFHLDTILVLGRGLISFQLLWARGLLHTWLSFGLGFLRSGWFLVQEGPGFLSNGIIDLAQALEICADGLFRDVAEGLVLLCKESNEVSQEVDAGWITAFRIPLQRSQEGLYVLFYMAMHGLTERLLKEVRRSDLLSHF